MSAELLAYIPEKLYVVPRYGSSAGDYSPIASMVVAGTDATSKKRMQKQHSGRKFQNDTDYLENHVVTNTPRTGFFLLQSASKDGFYIEDPLGFTIEVKTSFLIYILKNATIDKGEILQACVWGRETNGANCLLVENSDEYESATMMTKYRSSSVVFSKVKIGNTVVTRLGQTLDYYGKMKTLNCNRYYWNREKSPLLTFGKTLEYFINPKYTQPIDYVSPKIAAIINNREITPLEARNELNDKLSNANSYYQSTPYFLPDTEFDVVVNKIMLSAQETKDFLSLAPGGRPKDVTVFAAPGGKNCAVSPTYSRRMYNPHASATPAQSRDFSMDPRFEAAIMNPFTPHDRPGKFNEGNHITTDMNGTELGPLHRYEIILTDKTCGQDPYIINF